MNSGVINVLWKVTKNKDEVCSIIKMIKYHYRRTKDGILTGSPTISPFLAFFVIYEDDDSFKKYCDKRMHCVLQGTISVTTTFSVILNIWEPILHT